MISPNSSGGNAPAVPCLGDAVSSKGLTPRGCEVREALELCFLLSLGRRQRCSGFGVTRGNRGLIDEKWHIIWLVVWKAWAQIPDSGRCR